MTTPHPEIIELLGETVVRCHMALIKESKEGKTKNMIQR